MLNYPTIKRSVISDLFSLQIAAAVNMVNAHKFKPAFAATNALTAVMRNYYFSQVFSRFSYSTIAFCFLFWRRFQVIFFSAAILVLLSVGIHPTLHTISLYFQGSGFGTVGTIQSVTSFRLFDFCAAILAITGFINSFHTNYISISCSKPQCKNVAWNSFFQKLTYKAENAGKKLIKVNPNYTSQTCLCGHREKKTLAQRRHHCLECGLSIHRDILSSKIILSLGQSGKDLTYLNRESVSLESLSITASV